MWVCESKSDVATECFEATMILHKCTWSDKCGEWLNDPEGSWMHVWMIEWTNLWLDKWMNGWMSSLNDQWSSFAIISHRPFHQTTWRTWDGAASSSAMMTLQLDCRHGYVVELQSLLNDTWPVNTMSIARYVLNSGIWQRPLNYVVFQIHNCIKWFYVVYSL